MLSLDEILKEVTKYFANNPNPTGIISTEKKEETLFSPFFINKLENFDKLNEDLQRLSIIKVSEGQNLEASIEQYDRPTHFTVFEKNIFHKFIIIIPLSFQLSFMRKF